MSFGFLSKLLKRLGYKRLSDPKSNEDKKPTAKDQKSDSQKPTNKKHKLGELIFIDDYTKFEKGGHLIEEASDGYFTCKCKSKIYQGRSVTGKFGEADKREYKEDYMRLEQTVKGKDGRKGRCVKLLPMSEQINKDVRAIEKKYKAVEKASEKTVEKSLEVEGMPVLRRIKNADVVHESYAGESLCLNCEKHIHWWHLVFKVDEIDVPEWYVAPKDYHFRF